MGQEIGICTTYPLMKEQQEEYKKFDKLRIEGIQAAERQCKKLKMGEIWKDLRAWSLVVKKKHRRKVRSRYLKQVVVAADMYAPMGASSEQECVAKQRQTLKNLKNKGISSIKTEGAFFMVEYSQKQTDELQPRKNCWKNS